MEARLARHREVRMRRVGSVWTAAAVACALAGCGESRSAPAAITQAGCAGCHSAPGEGPPFRDPSGSTDQGRITVGAHDAHLNGNISAPIACSECHTVPRTIGDPGHIEDSPDDLRFGPLARTGGASPTYTPPGCATVYCHGSFAGGNGANAPTWLAGAAAAACGTCHGLPPATGRHAEHVGVQVGGTPVTCNTCHGPVGNPTHVNGIKNVVITNWDPEFRTCAQACHQPRAWGQ
jgi:predicted CxxxxCH...CXXCH cytochrome family protein